MDEKAPAKDREIEWSGDAPSLESLRQLRLTALLADVMDELGQVKAARKLGVDRKTLWRCRNTGRLTPRLTDALERLLLAQDLTDAMRQGERVAELERRVAQLQGELRAVHETVEDGGAAAGEEQARAVHRLERRVARLEGARGIKGASEAEPKAPAKPTVAPPWREYRDLVTEDAEPGEELVYGEATPVVVEWRGAKAMRNEALATATALQKAEAEISLLERELELIEEHGLTLPPATYPWDRSGRRAEVRDRREWLGGARMERNRALLWRWLRRILSCGLWRK